LTGVVPNVARLLMNPFWGWVFDRANFFVLRIVLNVGFALGIFIFFTGQTAVAFVCGALIHGMANGGGDVAWGLWVTKFAPPNRVADYMSVHTFFTGIRGVLAPVIAFHVIGVIAVPMLAVISCTLIVVASLLLMPVVKQGRDRRPVAALVEEVSE
jgi:MFS family permease